jgi:A/G-specific adenine glycosylase
MLQQTWAARVSEKDEEFLKRSPTVQRLAEASLGNVLGVWSGIRYNRRAKHVRDTAKTIIGKYKDWVSKDKATLRALSGVGLYTAIAKYKGLRNHYI